MRHSVKIKEFKSFYDSNLNKDHLQRKIQPVILPFVQKHFDTLKKVGVPLDRNILMNKNPRKSLLLDILVAPFYNMEAFQLFRKHAPKELITLIDEMLWMNQIIHQDDILKKFGITIYSSEYVTYWGSKKQLHYSPLPMFSLFLMSGNDSYYYNHEIRGYNLGISGPMKRLLFDYYETPENAKLNGLKTIKKTYLQYTTGEQDIALEIPRILAYYQQGQIKYSAKGKPAISTLGKMQRILKLKSFYPDAEFKDLVLLRTRLIAGIIGNIRKSFNISTSHDVVKKLISEDFLHKYETFQCLFTHVSGTGYLDDYYTNENVEHSMMHILKSLPAGEWISLENINDFITYNFLDVEIVHQGTARNKLYYGVKQKGYTEKDYIDSETYHNAIITPLVHGSLFLFGALGVLDLAYDEPDLLQFGETAFSSYDELKYVRLTPLGAYVTNKTKTYENSTILSESSIELSKDSLTIITDKNDTTADVILAPYAEQITPNRYRTDYTFFLKECKTKRDLENKINLFKQTVTDKLPPNWLDFFKELNGKIDPFTKVANITVFQIPMDNASLIQIIARDEKLKSLCTKSEGYRILVEKKKLAGFKKRLREFGYLIG